MHRKKHISSAIMIVLIIAFDQLTKYSASAKLKGEAPVSFIPNFVQFRYTENTGMAFSMFSGARWIFVILTFGVCLAALWYMYSGKCKDLWIYWSVGVVVSGGIGNLIDRVLHGFVVDFIEPVFVNFAVFNIADCAVTCGAAVLVCYLIADTFNKDKRETDE